MIILGGSSSSINRNTKYNLLNTFMVLIVQSFIRYVLLLLLLSLEIRARILEIDCSIALKNTENCTEKQQLCYKYILTKIFKYYKYLINNNFTFIFFLFS